VYVIGKRRQGTRSSQWQWRWARFWMKFAVPGRLGRFATRIAILFVPPYKGTAPLARLTDRGFIAPSAVLHHSDLTIGSHVYIGDRVTIFESRRGGSITIGNRVHLHQDTIIENGEGGVLTIGDGTSIQPRCQFNVYKGTLRIGSNVQIAAGCGFYPYNHDFQAEGDGVAKELRTRGGIVIEDGVWIGFGVTVLDGVKIGRGAVIGAGAVVTQDLPEGAVAVGVPARVVKMRAQVERDSSRDRRRAGL